MHATPKKPPHAKRQRVARRGMATPESTPMLRPVLANGEQK